MKSSVRVHGSLDSSAAGFWVRFMADCVDSLLLDAASCGVVAFILTVIYGIRWLIAILGDPVSVDSVRFLGWADPFMLQLILGVVRVGLAAFYFSYATFWYGTTLGKRCFHIYIVSVIGQPLSLRSSWIRCLSYCVSYLPLGAGFLMVLFHPQKRALHDVLAGTCAIVCPSNSMQPMLESDFSMEMSLR